MNNGEQAKVTCPKCGTHFDKEGLQRSCANCFACSSCEIYTCPVCQAEIVVKPMKKKISKSGQ